MYVVNDVSLGKGGCCSSATL